MNGFFSRLALAGVGLESILIYLVWLGDWRSQVPLFWLGIFPAFGLYLLCCFWVLRDCQVSLYVILVFALVFRVTVWCSHPTLSDDIFRYIWDGRVQAAGLNPYLFPPNAAELAFLRDELFARINHAHIPTIYPPLAQIFFVGIGSVLPGTAGFKVGLLLVEGGLLWLLLRLLGQCGKDPRRILLYAWNPLALVEVAGSGHVDILGVTLLFAALLALQCSRWTLALVALAAAVLAKFIPVLMLPLFWRELIVRRVEDSRRWFNWTTVWPLLCFSALVVGAFCWFGEARWQLLTGLTIYLSEWRFNAAAFSLGVWVLEILGAGTYGTPLEYAKLAVVLTQLWVIVWVIAKQVDSLKATMIVLGAYLLLSPTFHPWYLLWVLPFLPFFPQPSWIFLSGVLPLAYYVLVGYSTIGVWHENSWIVASQFGPFYVLLLVETLWPRWMSRWVRSSCG